MRKIANLAWLDFMRLVPVHTDSAGGYPKHSLEHLRQRDGFALTDAAARRDGARFPHRVRFSVFPLAHSFTRLRP